MVRAGASVRATDASCGAVQSLRVAESTTAREPRPTGGNRAGVAAPCPHGDTEPLLVGHLARIQPADRLGPGAHRGRARAASLASATPCRAPGRTAARSRRCLSRIGSTFCTEGRSTSFRASSICRGTFRLQICGGRRTARGSWRRKSTSTRRSWLAPGRVVRPYSAAISR